MDELNNRDWCLNLYGAEAPVFEAMLEAKGALIETFIRTVVEQLNNRDCCLNLYGAEAPVFEAMLEAKGALIETFIRTVVEQLNNRDCCLNLYGAEAPVFEAMLEAKGALIETFIRTVVEQLNNRDCCLNLYGAEAPVFEAMLEAKGALIETFIRTVVEQLNNRDCFLNLYGAEAPVFEAMLEAKGALIETFIRTVVEQLNNRDCCLNLYGAEAPVFEAMLEAKGGMLAVEFKQPSKFILTRTRTVKEESLPNNFAKLKVSDKNNDSNIESNNSNQDVNMNDDSKNGPHEIDTSKELNTTTIAAIENIDSSKFNRIARDEVKDTASAKIDVNIKDNIINKNSAESDGPDESKIFIQAILNATKDEIKTDIDMDVNNNEDDHLTQKSYENDLRRTILGANRVENKIVDKHSNINIENGYLKDMKVECDSRDLIESTETKDKENYILMNIEEIKKEKTDFEADYLNIAGLSDLDKDIQGLEMTILSAEYDVACHVKKENDSNDYTSDLEMAISETDLSFIKQEINDDSNISGKRSHSNSICSQELDPKKIKINTESDENVVIIKPKNPDEVLMEDIIKEVQTVMAKEVDKTGGFLPLLKCHGAQNGGLMYSCHDDDDVAWIKKVISDANLDLEMVNIKDFGLRKRSRELFIKINSYIPVDTKKIFRKFEIYNVGLDTKFWKVSYKQTSSTSVMFIVTVDEKSFQYISNENFSLYCGIDKAQFSIIY
ncbi:uncharacterized protein LOC134752595 [Cydia strobilella]|uniref:uncharacterized protein LOC134752595 n=1 Tax=Cydia strobilella TaxID=1100964 RepID=UPI00300769E7